MLSSAMNDDQNHSIPVKISDRWRTSLVVVDSFRGFGETAQGDNPGWSLWHHGSRQMKRLLSFGCCRRSRTAGAVTCAISVMTRLIVGVTVCTGIWTKALAVFKYGWWTAYVTAAAGAGTLHDCCRHQFVESPLFIAVNRYLVPEKWLRVAQCSQIMKMIITFVLLWSWSVRSGFSVLGWASHRYRLHRLVVIFNFV